MYGIIEQTRTSQSSMLNIRHAYCPRRSACLHCCQHGFSAIPALYAPSITSSEHTSLTSSLVGSSAFFSIDTSSTEMRAPMDAAKPRGCPSLENHIDKSLNAAFTSSDALPAIPEVFDMAGGGEDEGMLVPHDH